MGHILHLLDILRLLSAATFQRTQLISEKIFQWTLFGRLVASAYFVGYRAKRTQRIPTALQSLARRSTAKRRDSMTRQIQEANRPDPGHLRGGGLVFARESKKQRLPSTDKPPLHGSKRSLVLAGYIECACLISRAAAQAAGMTEGAVCDPPDRGLNGALFVTPTVTST